MSGQSTTTATPASQPPASLTFEENGLLIERETASCGTVDIICFQNNFPGAIRLKIEVDGVLYRRRPNPYETNFDGTLYRNEMFWFMLDFGCNPVAKVTWRTWEGGFTRFIDLKKTSR
jgi:hypothetical protein